MLLLRSEEDADAWCRARGRPRGAVMAVAQLWRLAAAWYGDRLDPDWRPRSVAQSQRILDAAGLQGAFWRLA